MNVFLTEDQNIEDYNRILKMTHLTQELPEDQKNMNILLEKRKRMKLIQEITFVEVITRFYFFLTNHDWKIARERNYCKFSCRWLRVEEEDHDLVGKQIQRVEQKNSFIQNPKGAELNWVLTSESPGVTPKLKNNNVYISNITGAETMFHHVLTYLPISFNYDRWSPSNLEVLSEEIKYFMPGSKRFWLAEVTTIIGRSLCLGKKDIHPAPPRRALNGLLVVK